MDACIRGIIINGDERTFRSWTVLDISASNVVKMGGSARDLLTV